MCTKNMSADRDNFLFFPKQMHLFRIILLPYFPGSADLNVVYVTFLRKGKYFFKYYVEY